jgi:polyisoprenyl-teichoic acid--peptidoglycan teichoic acid transferase
MVKKNKHKRSKIILILILIILIAASIAVYFYYKTSKMKRTPISKINSDLGITKETEDKLQKFDGIVNIALFGLDTRVKNESSRSDCIMIVTLDGMHDKIKISSVMRDTYVNVDGYGMTKITHAYAYGGPQLAVKTLNENFGLNIKDFVKVDFFSLENIVDSLGGLDINVAPDEVKLLNEGAAEVASIEKTSVELITKSGLQHLNGKQVVAYCRIRYTTGDDFKRTERQRDVLQLVIEKIKSKGSSGIMNIVNTMLPYVETSMTDSEIIKFGVSAISSRLYNNIEQERFPVDGYCWGKILKGVWYLDTDLKTTASQMQDYIFKDIKPVSK